MSRTDLLPLPAPSTPLLVGFSGGMDSTVLLHVLAASGARDAGLRAIHVHHGLQAEADDWARHCQAFCEVLGIALTIARVTVVKNAGLGPEAAARQARYRAFADELREGEHLALAHHQDDQAETMLLRLLRASGSDGLAAMRPQRTFALGVLWRPLLMLPRCDLLAYAREHDLHWIEDPSNDDVAMGRNYLRHRILPALAERWPQANQSLARSAALLAEDSLLLGTETDRHLALAQGLDPHTLSVTTLLAVKTAWRSRILRQWLASLNLPPLPGAGLAIIERELLQARPDAEPEYRWPGVVLRRWRDLLHVEIERPILPHDWQMDWNGEGELLLPTGDHMRLLPVATRLLPTVGAASAATATTKFETSENPVAPGAAAAAESNVLGAMFKVRGRRGGERITLPGRKHSHSLKKLLPECGIPPWQRERMPLLFAEDGELLAAGDFLVSARFQAWCTAQGQHLSWPSS